MAFCYAENPLLFVNSSDSTVPSGRNVRTICRTSHAAAHHAVVTKDSGHFEVLNFKRKRSCNTGGIKTTRRNPKKIRQANSRRSSDLPVTLHIGGSMPTLLIQDIKPRAPSLYKILKVANFHIRRTASITLCHNPNRLVEVLRCRQWSYVSIGWDRIDPCACLDHALTCLASKLCQMTGWPISHVNVLSRYTIALQSLQAALGEQGKYENDHLLVTSQLLAVYEMLDSLDNVAWRQHLNGAESLSLSKIGSRPVQCRDEPSFSAAVVPMVTDALLSGNAQFFKLYNWRAPLHSLIDDSQIYSELATCLSQVPELLIDVELNTRCENLDPRTAYALLDRAHALKARIYTELLRHDVLVYDTYGQREPFDKLGFYLAALLSLDQLITSLRPVQTRWREAVEDETGELCTQLLNLELRAAEEYPSADLLSAFRLSTP